MKSAARRRLRDELGQFVSKAELEPRLGPVNLHEKTGNTHVEEDYEKKQLSLWCNRALKTLTPREETVIRMRFGFYPYKHSHTLEEIGLKFDVARERARQIQEKALRKLRHPYRSKFLATFIEVPDFEKAVKVHEALKSRLQEREEARKKQIEERVKELEYRQKEFDRRWEEKRKTIEPEKPIRLAILDKIKARTNVFGELEAARINWAVDNARAQSNVYVPDHLLNHPDPLLREFYRKLKESGKAL